MNIELKNKVLANVSKEVSCWPWVGSRNRDGYGQLWDGNTMKMATHLMWFITCGSWPKVWLLHKCDNPCCVNPEHLFEGTQQDNNKDRHNKNRTVRGSKQGLAKLTEEIVPIIRSDYATGVYTLKAIAEKYGVKITAMWSLLHRKTWTHVSCFLLIISLTSCATRTVVIDSQTDVVRIGNNVSGNVSIWNNTTRQWEEVKKMHIPEGWFAGPMVLTNNF